jgi:8-oxo-dGTP pyrophosphatase MutT (NUDIX family)
MKFELAACVLIPTHNTVEEVLAISRRNDFTQWGIPGGKQEPYETTAIAAVREIKEECGILLQSNNLVPIYSGPCYGKDGRNFWVTTYLNRGPYEGQLRPEKGFEIRPMELDDMCMHAISPFASYNQEVLCAWRTFQ